MPRIIIKKIKSIIIRFYRYETSLMVFWVLPVIFNFTLILLYDLNVYWQALQILVYYNVIHISVDLKMAQPNGLKHVIMWTPVNIDESQYRLIPKTRLCLDCPYILEYIYNKAGMNKLKIKKLSFSQLNPNRFWQFHEFLLNLA
jgi:hypothetical protein